MPFCLVRCRIIGNYLLFKWRRLPLDSRYSTGNSRWYLLWRNNLHYLWSKLRIPTLNQTSIWLVEEAFQVFEFADTSDQLDELDRGTMLVAAFHGHKREDKMVRISQLLRFSASNVKRSRSRWLRSVSDRDGYMTRWGVRGTGMPQQKSNAQPYLGNCRSEYPFLSLSTWDKANTNARAKGSGSGSFCCRCFEDGNRATTWYIGSACETNFKGNGIKLYVFIPPCQVTTIVG